MYDIPISELERRMRPGAWSVKGFLGPKEKLSDVIREDEAALQRLCVTYEQIAEKIEELIKAGQEAEVLYYSRKRNDPAANPAATIGHFSIRTRSYLGDQYCPWSFLDHSKKPPYKPCTIESGPMYGDIDFVITNNRTGETLKGPGLIVHLIRDHHFFEGKQSPYRVDPEKAARVLELVKE